MVKFTRLFVAPGESLRRRVETLVILLVTTVLMLFGVGQRLLDSHNNLADADHLAALSLIMSGVPQGAVPVTFLDVDDETRRAWGATDATPRGAIAALIDQARGNGATAILVDFDLVGGGDASDAALVQLLTAYPADAPHLMLARRMKPAASGANGSQIYQSVPTPFDDAAKGKANVHWVTTLNDVGADRSVRRIKLWATACSGKDGTSYPSAAMVVAAHVDEADGRSEGLRSFLDHRVRVECGADDRAAPPAWPPVGAANVILPYVFADSAGVTALFRVEANGRSTVALRRISAGLLVKYAGSTAEPAGNIDKDPFAGRVVIVGASYSDSGDSYETPFGTMPGALILANSVVQAKKIVETPPVSPFTRNLLTVLLFLALAVIARTLVGAAAVLALGLVTLATLFLVSRWLGFSTGIDVISVAVPGFALFKLVDSLIAIGMNVPKKGWRALVRS